MGVAALQQFDSAAEAIGEGRAGIGRNANSDYLLNRGRIAGRRGFVLAEILSYLAGIAGGNQKIESGPSSKRKICVSFAMSARTCCAIDAMLILAPCLAFGIACVVAGIMAGILNERRL